MVGRDGRRRQPTVSGYSYVDQTISELSAEGAPTRVFTTVASGIPYAALMTVFGVGIRRAAGGTRAGRITATLVVGEAVWGFAGGILFPMAIRGNEQTLRNSLHAPYGVGTPILFLLAMGFGTRLFGKRFRYVTYSSVVTLLVFGASTAMQSGRIPANEPTPWLGVEERANAYAAMLWLAVLAIALMRADGTVAPQQSEKPPVTARTMRAIPW